jgi:hypothetical protein
VETRNTAPRFVYIDKDGNLVQQSDLAAVTKLSEADARKRGLLPGAGADPTVEGQGAKSVEGPPQDKAVKKAPQNKAVPSATLAVDVVSESPEETPKAPAAAEVAPAGAGKK